MTPGRNLLVQVVLLALTVSLTAAWTAEIWCGNPVEAFLLIVLLSPALIPVLAARGMARRGRVDAEACGALLVTAGLTVLVAALLVLRRLPEVTARWPFLLLITLVITLFGYLPSLGWSLILVMAARQDRNGGPLVR